MVAQGIDPEMLPGLAITTLRAWKVEIPARSTLERHIGNATAGGAGRLWQHFLARLPSDFREAIDRLLEVADGERYSTLFQLKQYPPEATPAVILSYLDRFEHLRSMGVERIDVSDLNTKIVEQLAGLGYHYGARDLRRFSPPKRYALVTCFLVEAQKTTLDHLVEMHRQFLTGVARRSRRAVELRQKEVRQRAKRGLAIVLQAMDIILDEERPAETRLADLYREFDEKTLRDAVETCRNLNELTEYGYLDELVARHAHLKRYLPRFLTLPTYRSAQNAAALIRCYPRSTSAASSRLASWTSCQRTRRSSSYRARGASRCSTAATGQIAGCGSSRSRSRSATRCARVTCIWPRADITSRFGTSPTRRTSGRPSENTPTQSCPCRWKPTRWWRACAPSSMQRRSRLPPASRPTPSPRSAMASLSSGAAMRSSCPSTFARSSG